jgi:hypothetical protein
MGADEQTFADRAKNRLLDAVQGTAAVDRRSFLAGMAGSAMLAGLSGARALAAENEIVNLARVATPVSSAAASEGKLEAMNDGATPARSADRDNGLFVVWNWRSPGDPAPWVQYEWAEPVQIDKVDIYWAIDPPRPKGIPGADGDGLSAPESYKILYWNGSSFLPVTGAKGLGLAADAFNTTSFDAVKTTKLRLEMIPKGSGSGILEWKVYNHGMTPELGPNVRAGLDRSVVLGAETYLSGKAAWLTDSPANRTRWAKRLGPGEVRFRDAAARATRAGFSAPGEYELELDGLGAHPASSPLHVHVEQTPPSERLDVVYTRRYAISSPFWRARAKSLIVNWISHCIRMCERTDIAKMRGDGGLDNFIEAAKALRGEPHGEHKGFVFSNAWVHQTVESMCIALMVDPEGDAEIAKAQEQMRASLERWIPIILAAQMPDGYLQTAYILSDRKQWPERWSPDHRGNHEGYVSGYFIESAINHYTLTEGKDLRLYNAAKRLADCWVANLGPGKKAWFDGHQEMEQALVRFGRFVNDVEGKPKGDAYIALAKFLLDSRRGGSEYDQSHLPPGEQYEAVGHAVRAMYFYSGMADIAAETKDPDYQSAVISLWDNMVNRKYYVTGGIGSGETSEGFGPNYSLGNDAYCESCSSCGLIFFQYKLNLAYHDARYADLYEETMYNALLGSMALDGKSFTYTNPLVNVERAKWHVCPCCVGNISRTLLMLPTWSYVKRPQGLYVNLFVGGRTHVGEVAGTGVEVVQQTNYPWDGKVGITVNPEEKKKFTLYVRVPGRSTSKLYTASPAASGLLHFAVNGEPVQPRIEKGYAVVEREWTAGDRVELELPMEPQRIVADARLEADCNAVALRYGPLVYNVEQADNANIDQPIGDAPLKAEWRPDLLGGVVAITGKWRDGSPLVAVPNYARGNRVGPPAEYPVVHPKANPPITTKVWIRTA